MIGRMPMCLEPISKSSEEDNEACELDKAEEVLSVVLPADEYATLPLYPGEEALDEPAPLVRLRRRRILRGRLAAIGTMATMTMPSIEGPDNG